MQNSISHWLLDNLTDWKSARYRFLGYLQQVYRDLDEMRLFPVWEDVYERYRSIKDLEDRLSAWNDRLPKILTGLNDSGPVYRHVPFNGEDWMEQVQERLEFAIPALKLACKRSESLRKDIESQLTLEPLGLWVANRREGIFLVQIQNLPDVWSWYYSTSVHTGKRGYTALRSNFLGKYTYTLGGGLKEIRDLSLQKAGLKQSVVSSWYVHTALPMPVFSTVKPAGMLLLSRELGLE